MHSSVIGSQSTERLRVEVRGAVQGVGFRPFVYRLARDLDLAGWVQNDSRGVFLELEGPRSQLDRFLHRLPQEKPPRAIIHRIESAWLSPTGFSGIAIRESDDNGLKSAVVLPEVAVCDDCLREIFDPADRRYRYPFTNCTNCGPRFSIVRSLPYDRPNTSMHFFQMCDLCRREYDDPLDRRFHAQPNACPDCGPRLSLAGLEGRAVTDGDEALCRTAEALLAGKIAAVKGLGGFHLMADAANEATVRELRKRKRRYYKPFALMVKSIQQARSLCEVSTAAAELLCSPEAPIVLLPRLPEVPIAAEVAPQNPYLGIMLPYTPLHHLLMKEVDTPIVATSGNLRDEPICIDNAEAQDRLGRIADLFLFHDRPIVRHMDDSVMRELSGTVQPVRRARGYAPLPIRMEREQPAILAVGAHQKNVIGLSVGSNVFLSQHIGDMETPQAKAAFERVIHDFLSLYDVRPDVVACDLHPDYPSTQWVERIREGPTGEESEVWWKSMIQQARFVSVQHHHAHLAACLADNSVDGPALGVTWDGTGYGPDGTIWGGEFLLGDATGFERVARIKPFRLLGAEAAILEPRRVALALMWEALGEAVFEAGDLPSVRSIQLSEKRLFSRMLERGYRSPLTSSVGRLFDGVAAILDLRQRVTFEGEAAMALEFVAGLDVEDSYPVGIVETVSLEEAGATNDPGDRPAEPRWQLDWQPLLAAILDDLHRGVEVSIIAARFHNALAEAVVAIAREVSQPVVALTGGCFQNRLLTERARHRLESEGFRVLVHRRVPPNDGSICLGQVAVAAASVAGQENAK